jgi:hypothetical protein
LFKVKICHIFVPTVISQWVSTLLAVKFILLKDNSGMWHRIKNEILGYSKVDNLYPKLYINEVMSKKHGYDNRRWTEDNFPFSPYAF